MNTKPLDFNLIHFFVTFKMYTLFIYFIKVIKWFFENGKFFMEKNGYSTNM